MSTIETLAVDNALAGFVKIWKVHPATGESSLVVDKPNLILRGGTKILAHVLAGDSTHKISGMYIGYNNTSSFTKPNIDVEYSSTFSGQATGNFGYLKEPLTFDASYTSTTGGYSENTALFTTMITSSSSAGGQPFNTNSYIYEVALIASPPSGDIVFSRTNFNQIKYDNTYNFTITWGVRILLPS